MSSSQRTGEVRPDDKQSGYFPCRNSGFGRSSAILRFGGALRERATLSKAANSGKVASEPGPIRQIPVKT